MSWWQTPVLTVIDTILRAVAAGARDRIPAGHYSDLACILLAGTIPGAGRTYTHVEPLAGGWGGRRHTDGPSATYTIGHGDTYNIPVEVLETRFPLLVERYALRTDSGGPGRRRGGLGLQRTYRMLNDGMLNALSERSRCRPWGLWGGGPAEPGNVVVQQPRRARQRFQKVTGLRLAPGASVTFFSGGGGGYGNPLDREPERVAEDVRLGYVSRRAAAKEYGVVVRGRGLTLDQAATARLRAALRPARRSRRRA